MAHDLEGSYIYDDPQIKTLGRGETTDGGRWSCCVTHKPVAVRWVPNWRRDEHGIWVQVEQSMTPAQRMKLVKESK